MTLMTLGRTKGANERSLSAVPIEADEIDLFALVLPLPALHVLYHVRRHLRLHLSKIYNTTLRQTPIHAHPIILLGYYRILGFSKQLLIYPDGIVAQLVRDV